MKLNLVLLSTALLASSVAFSAIPSKVQDILSLPTENRLHVANQQGRQFYKELIAISFSKDQPMATRWKALTLAAQVGQQKSITDLQKAAKSPDWFMRNAALLSAQEVSKDEAYDMARSLIKDKALVVRSAAVEVLSQFPNPSVRDLFWEEVYQDYNVKKGQSLWVRSQILNYLSKQPLAHEKSLFASLLKDKDVQVQKTSVAALEKITGRMLGTEKDTWSKKISLWQGETSKK